MGYFVGIDLGSTAIKTVFVKDGAFAWFKAVPTAPGQERLAQAVMEEGLAALGASEADIDASRPPAMERASLPARTASSTKSPRTPWGCTS